MKKFSRSIEELRNHFPLASQCAYFETASTGLIPDFVYEGARRYIDDRYNIAGNSKWTFDDADIDTLEMMNRSKNAIASMIHCKAEDIAFGMSATHMFTLVTEGIEYKSFENIVTVDKGWIGARYALQKRQAEGLEVRFVAPVDGIVTAEMLINACDKNTKAIAVNLVESTTGYRINIDQLGEYCSSHNIYLFVDAVQALGVLDINVEKSRIDFMVGNDYKWMSNFSGTGFAYISPRVRKEIKHWGAGWMSDTDRFDTSKVHLCLRDDAGRFEIGHQNISGIYGLGLVAQQNLIIGTETIEKYVLDLAEYFIEKVNETNGIRLRYILPVENRSQIVVVVSEKDISEEMLESAKIRISSNRNSSGESEMRFAFHHYNTKDDIDRFIDYFKNI